ncbi:hypothetical protein TorRG33x02_057760 [Trema orientale]|uniref:Uncharacterized protein n=1 Tax=Trema orientale TaxID=63057 RepID=A0A2P5FL60_TREOI|nr:hypothetical protein TorRG33x02_057760 [Trema orientale]
MDDHSSDKSSCRGRVQTTFRPVMPRRRDTCRRHDLDGLSGVLEGSVLVLGHRLLVLLSSEVLVMVALEVHHLCVVENC